MATHHTSIKARIEITESEAREEIGEFVAAKRKEVIAQGGSCLSCKHTKTTSGYMLRCDLKDKRVQQYSYCDKWIPIASEENLK